jgi:hypothetical protein
MSASKETNDSNTKFILRLCAVLFVLAVGALAYQHAKADDFNTPEYALTSDFIESDRKCNNGDQGMCERVVQICTLMTPQKVRELHRYIRHDYPFKSKNGGMNITTRYIMALRKCSAEPEAGVQLTSAAARG